MENIIISAIIILILAGAGFYVYRLKKSGSACPGCPCSKQCGGKCCCAESEKKH